MRRFASTGLLMLAIVAMAFAQPDMMIFGNQDVLNYGQVPVGIIVNNGFMVMNVGNEDLEITAVVTGEAFTLIPDSLGEDNHWTLPPRDRGIFIQVAFAPQAEIVYAGELVLTSNDLDTPELTIALAGEGIEEFPPPPEILELIAPDNMAHFDDFPITFSWQGMNVAGVSYNLEFMPLDSMRFEPIVFNAGEETEYVINEGDIADNTTYLWSVNASQAGMIVGQSMTYLIYIGENTGPEPPPPPPDMIELIAPEEAAVFDDLPITFTWSEYDEADVTYTLELVPLMVNPEDSLFFEPVVFEIGDQTSFTLVDGDIEVEMAYFWNVNAWEGEELAATSVPRMIFIGIDGPPPPPGLVDLIMPEDGAIVEALPLTFTWEAVPTDQIVNYTLEFMPMDDRWDDPAVFEAGEGTTFIVEAGALENGIYLWTVNAWDNEELFATAIPRVLYLGVDGPPPPPGQLVLLLPEEAAEIDDLPITFTWEAYDEAQSYTLELSAMENNPRDSLFFEPVVFDAGDATSLTLEAGDLEGETVYLWTVIGWSEENPVASGMSRILYLGVDGPAPPPPPPGNFGLLTPMDEAIINQLPVTFTWEEAQTNGIEDVEYLLFLCPEDSMRFGEYVFEAGNNTFCEVTLEDLEVNPDQDVEATYFWYVMAAVNDQIVAFSNETRVFSLVWEDIWASLAVNDDSNSTPMEFAISSVYPNPFNPEVTIGISVPSESRITAKIYDVLGRQVALIYDNKLTVGHHNFNWHGTAAGTYFLRVNNDTGWSEVSKLILMK